jgi:sulfur carrier protein
VAFLLWEQADCLGVINGNTVALVQKRRNIMNITLNGEKKDAPEGLTVLGLLQHLKIQPERVAVELNLNVVKKGDYATAQVKDGDSVEVVSFMAGGNAAQPRS